MRTRAALVSVLASTAVLVIGWDLGAAGSTPAAPAPEAAAPAVSTPTPVPTSSSGSSGSGTFEVPTPSSTPSTPSAPAGTGGTDSSGDTDSTGGTDGTYTGTAVATRYGDVQVAITVAGGAITDVTALQLTDKENRSVSISNRAAPILRSEVLAAQSADVASVSGATYTSDAYLDSLQSAIDQAGL
ncbi:MULTISPECIES: FMN-binding protein [unclassified Rathayibacter]|uniref:FMN-binding protein n=1 Tax=unclassified Rathayibacter TaxID=2609250 RepID=UPI001FB2E0E2|nr:MULTISPECIES: FMN-binding protein [unclassified Rathayibacter]MCJ1674497.1 FMN-binding protein [Rathayibacter sp. VKM Ac-2929]MCJ1684778.1 FMN-binding protein [Rathayibacter sp. VKM Ac-2928]MCJ1687414.1 FMN-binding protein [Rathayibacter sp. VKM Ac-2927]